MRSILKNKKADSMKGWTEVILFSLLFVVMLTAVLAHFNAKYEKDYSVGLDTSGMDEFTAYVGSADDQVRGGEVEHTAEGLTLKSSWAVAKGIYSTVWSFFNGSWINVIIIGIFKMEGVVGITVALILRTMFLASLIFLIIKLFFKVKP
jgi:hypothetical protein